MVQHLLGRPGGLDVGGDAGRRGPLHAPLVNGELAEGAAEALPAHAGQHVQAEVAIGRLVEVLQAPKVVAILADVLQFRRTKKEYKLDKSHAQAF